MYGSIVYCNQKEVKHEIQKGARRMTMTRDRKNEWKEGYRLMQLGGYNTLRERYWKGSPWRAFRDLQRNA